MYSQPSSIPAVLLLKEWQVWAATEVQNFANGVASDINGNIYVTGNFEDTIIFDNVTLISEGNSDIFIVKYDASGNLLWAKRAGGPNFVYANDIAVDTSGNCYVVGSFTTLFHLAIT